MNTQDIAGALWQAMEDGRHMPSEWAGKFSLQQGYEVQLALLQRRLARGERQTGWKVGLTAEAMRVQQQVHEPCFGYLLESGRHASGQAYRFSDLIAPGFENELCLTIGKTLRGPGVSLEEVAAAVTHAAPALEIVEVRGPFAGNLALAMADNAQQKAYVTGAAVPLTADNRDLAGANVTVQVDGAVSETASGSAVMQGGGLLSVLWLANKLAEFGLALEAGMQVMSGSFTRQYRASQGMRVQSSFDRFGTVAANFI
ncbi:2-oxo-hepta-3-ene-1,7-dioic acid hydratase [Variovorax sp. V118]|uniref:2-keto-4-pentenoate hydratase n=1 Tax=Variovorax sp. V118 TaxID=3065954 RepID=UPI0034E894EF